MEPRVIGDDLKMFLSIEDGGGRQLRGARLVQGFDLLPCGFGESPRDARPELCTQIPQFPGDALVVLE